MRVACVGAGPAGLYLAILLKRRDPSHEVTVYERRAQGMAPGGGVVFWDDLLSDLRGSDPPSAEAILREAFCWRDQVVAIQGKPPLRVPARGYSIRRQRLLDLLGERALQLGVRLHFERPIEDPAQLPEVELLVAADGAGSALRQRHAGRLGTRVVQGRNVYVWLATPRLFPAFTFGLVPTHAGWIWFHAYGFEPATSTLIVECAPETWTGLGLDRLGAAQGLALLERLFAQWLEGHRLLAPTLDAGGLPWRHFRRVTNETWHVGHLVLAGDAAHTTHFAIGSGTRLAMQDAISLAAALSGARGGLAAALATYQRERQQALLLPQRAARLSAEWFENVPRYAGLAPPQFATLLLNRRSPLMPRLPPRLYLLLRWAANVPGLRRLPHAQLRRSRA